MLAFWGLVLICLCVLQVVDVRKFGKFGVELVVAQKTCFVCVYAVWETTTFS